MEENKMKNWKRIWGNRYADRERLNGSDVREVFMELKRLTGNDTLSGQGVSYEAYIKQFSMVRREMSFSPVGDRLLNSYFEVGCGSGALLFLLQQDGLDIGGVDYSPSFIEAAEQVIKTPRELYCAEASELDTSIKYDCVFSFSAFEYFYDYDYAKRVMEKMLEKANYSVAILDVHDKRLDKAYEDYRRSVIADYDVKYADLKKLFYEREFFIDFAIEHDLDIKLTGCRLDGYWNAPFTFDVYFFKR